MTNTARVTDINGYYEIPRNPLSKVGVFPYTAKSCQAPGWEADPGRIVMVYRPEETLADPETLSSFRLVPWVDEHAMLGDPAMDASLTPVEKKGVHGTTGERIEYDPSDRTMYGNIKLWSSSLADAIEAGKKDLSMGFRCVYEFVSGVFEGQPYQAIQRKMRGNHQASVPFGRMGPEVAVLDHFSFALDASELREKTMTAKIKLSAKLGTAAVALLASSLGVAATDPKFTAAMDAEVEADGEGDKGGKGVTLEEIGTVLADAAPAIAKITEAAALMAGIAPAESVEDPALDEDMEPVLDAGGQPVMENGKPKMQKKAAALDATPPALAAMDAAIAGAKLNAASIRKMLPAGAATPPALAAMDSAISAAEVQAAAVRRKFAARKSPVLAAMDARLSAAEKVLAEAGNGNAMKAAFAEIASRDKLAKQVSNFVGTFDHSEMDTLAVAKYGIEKLGIQNVPAGAEVATLNGYLHNRDAAPAKASAFGMDAAPGAAGASSVDAYLSGGVKAA